MAISFRGALALIASIGAIAAAEPMIWVSHDFMGGPKCVASGPVSHYDAPGFEAEKQKFQTVKIRTYREHFRDKATCEACYNCPNYHREILFEIRARDANAAEKIGYGKAPTPPTYDELKPSLPKKEDDHSDR